MISQKWEMMVRQGEHNGITLSCDRRKREMAEIKHQKKEFVRARATTKAELRKTEKNRAFRKSTKGRASKRKGIT